MKGLKSYIAVIFLTLSLFGCAHKNMLAPVYDKVQTYPLAYDLAYMNILDALSGRGDWEIESTAKEEGVIQVRNINFKELTDNDQRIIVFDVKRLERNKTSIEIAKNYQQVIGGKELMATIDAHLKRQAKL